MQTTMGKTKKRQRREGTPLDDGPDDPFTVGDPSHDLTEGRDDPPGGATGGGEDNRRGGGERVTIEGRGVEFVRLRRLRRHSRCHTPCAAVVAVVIVGVIICHRGGGRCKRGAVVHRRQPQHCPR